MDKQILRTKIKNLRKSMDTREIAEKNEKIRENLSKIEAVKNAKNILIYVSYGREVDTKELINDFFDAGKNVFVPKVIDLENGLMIFFKIDSLEDLKKGTMGILEPKKECVKLTESLIDDEYIIIMPGLAFDKKGHRLGYGGGFYDRFNARIQRIFKVALCFNYQVLEDVSIDEYDINVDMIVTDKEIIDCK